jgi:hypothetical protein
VQFLDVLISASDEPLDLISRRFPLALVVAEVPDVTEPLDVSPHGYVDDPGILQRIVEVADRALLPPELDPVTVADRIEVTFEDNPSDGARSPKVPAAGKVARCIEFRIEQVRLE